MEMLAALEEKEERPITMALVVSLVAAALALAGVVAVFAVDQDNLNRVKRLAADRRGEIALADFSMCSKVYGQIYQAQVEGIKQANLRHYEQVLPDVPVRSLKLLIKDNIRQAKENERKFDPEQCKKLPTYSFIPKGKHAK
jgi:hypothetical protein